MKNIGIYGTGLAGEEVFHAMQKMKIQVNFFLDGDSGKVGSSFCGVEILDIGKVDEDAFILIAANPAYGIHERLFKVGISQWEYVDPEFLRLLGEGYDRGKIRAVLRENEDRIRRVYGMLADEKSREVFRAVLQHRLEHKLSLLSNVYDENQYFGNDIIGRASGNFVDCGAYNGDTFRRFLSQVGGGVSLLCF